MGAYEHALRYATSGTQVGRPSADSVVQDLLVRRLGKRTSTPAIDAASRPAQDEGVMRDEHVRWRRHSARHIAGKTVGMRRELLGGKRHLLREHWAFVADAEASNSSEGTGR